MLLITTAFLEEAKLLIRLLELKAKNSKGPISVYENKNLKLIVTGLGQKQATFATAWALGRYEKVDAILNFGLAGASEKIGKIGEPYLINYLRLDGEKSEYIPDILWKHPFKEATLTTYTKPVEYSDEIKTLVDMEAAAICYVGTKFISPERISFLKIISDYLAPETFKKEKVEGLIAPNIEEIVEWIKTWPGFQSTSVSEIPLDIKTAIEAIPFSITQQGQLKSWIKGELLRGSGEEEILSLLDHSEIKHKREANALFEKIKYAIQIQ